MSTINIHGQMSEFIQTVKDLRKAQKSFFKDRRPSDLQKSRELERKVDEMISEMEKAQTNLFSTSKTEEK